MKTGECCQGPLLVMTQQEADVLAKAAPPDVSLSWTPSPDPRFVGLVGSPCPLLGPDNLCRAYDSRPFNCRRFACMRAPGDSLVRGGVTGCLNADRRLSERSVRRFLTVYQRPAVRWARRHGWTEDMQ